MKQKTKLEQIYEEVAYDTGEKPSVVKRVIKELFTQIGIHLIKNAAPVMIRGFIKIVVATRAAKSNKKDYRNYETREN
tara:strand:- start:151 stop:384 length:234 start_codon:yes stop_codon:yes gene_type:complete